MTFEAWRTLVKIAFQGGEPTTALLMRAVTDGARAITVRDVESDLPLAKSYRDAFRDAKAQLAGTRITDDIATVIATVRGLMPIDDDTSAIDAIVVNAITAAYDDINGTADRWDKLLLEVAVEMQRHVPFFQVRQLTTFLSTTDGVTTDGFVSKVALPAQARIQQLWYGHYYAALEPDVEYAADDIVISNGRAYKVVTGGTLTIYDIGAGLTSTDGDNEDLGDLVFSYYDPERDWPVRKLDWNNRNVLAAGDFSGGPAYAIGPQMDELWLYPPLDTENRFDLEWVGVVDDFEDEDEVTFDEKAASCAAHFIRSALAREIMGDARTSAAEFALFQRELRGLVIDNEQRDQGSPVSVALYDYRRRWRCCGTCGILTEDSNNASTDNVNPPNSENSQTNTGDVITIRPESSNHVETIAFNGSAGARVVAIDINRQLQSGGSTRSTSGDRVTVMATFLVAAIEPTFYNATQSGAELGTYSSEYANEARRFDFYYDGNQWQYMAP